MSRKRAALVTWIALGLIQNQMHAQKVWPLPFGVLYGWPPPLIPGQTGDFREYGQIGLHKFLRGLVYISRETARHLGHPEPASMTLKPLHP
jgi:hypothetical protein